MKVNFAIYTEKEKHSADCGEKNEMNCMNALADKQYNIPSDDINIKIIKNDDLYIKK